jgi:hypothetical protein
VKRIWRTLEPLASRSGLEPIGSLSTDPLADALRRAASLSYLLLAQGGSAAAAASKLHLSDYVPAGKPVPTAAQLELSRTPQPSAAQLAQARALQVSDAEAVALARNQALVYSIANGHPDGPPICAGPLIFHEDGIVECHYCVSPETRIHARGCTASCRPQRRLGKGHHCPRCYPEPAA